jgi:hypothetical protein
MLGGGARDARRTDRYLDGLLDADQRGADEIPTDTDLDPSIRLAARVLRADLVRVHPSFRFEDGLAVRLAQNAARMTGRSTAATPVRREAVAASISNFPAPLPVGAAPAAPGRSNHVQAARPRSPLVVGGVGVASAAISLGAVYVAWRWSRSSQVPMVRAVRAARSGRGHAAGHGKRAAVLHGILGVMP